jgi:adenine-specific DNA-methyltransferase
MSQKQRLELTWVGKNERPRVEPRVLIVDDELSHYASARVTDHDIFDNRLIFGDNLLALKSLEQEFVGKVKCIYIDPPFNTQQAQENYDDGVEHSTWLSLMRDRLEVLHRLLKQEGTLFVHIDDNELGYLIALTDEIFGRKNRAYVITFKQASATGHKSINPGCVSTTNFILIYSKNKEFWNPNRVFTSRERDKRYNQFIPNIDDPFGQWTIEPLIQGYAQSLQLPTKEARKRVKRDPSELDTFVMKSAHQVAQLVRPDYDSVSKEARELIDRSRANPKKIFRLKRDGYSDIYLIGGQRILFYSEKLKLIDGVNVAGEPLTTLWDDILSNNLHKEGGVDFPKGKKPEALIKRCLDLAELSPNLGDGRDQAAAI